jgi:hypothetical protein
MLTNWDLFQSSTEELPIGQEFSLGMGWNLKVYQSWTYLSHPAIKSENPAFRNEVLFQKGLLTVGYSTIAVCPLHEPEGILVIAQRVNYEEEMSKTYYLAIGVWALDGLKYVGIRESDKKKCQEHILALTTPETGPFRYPGERETMMGMLENGMRANQGDLHAAKVIGGIPVSVTKPGAAETPRLRAMFA